MKQEKAWRRDDAEREMVGERRGGDGRENIAKN